MSDEPDDVVSLVDAEAMLPEGDTVHTFRGGGMMLIGADWSRDAVLKAMRSAEVIRPSGAMALSMKHGIAIFDDGWLFIETTRNP